MGEKGSDTKEGKVSYSVAWEPQSLHHLKLVYDPHVSLDGCPAYCANEHQLNSVHLLRALWKNDCLYGSLGARMHFYLGQYSMSLGLHS